MIIEIGNEFYQVFYTDNGFPHEEDKGLWRACKIAKDMFERWYCCDDNDYMIDPESRRIVAVETGWVLTRFEVKTS